MKTWLSGAAVAGVGIVLWTGAALGQSTPKSGCEAVKAGAPRKVEGQVISVDANQHKLTVKTGDGKTHDFQASPEMIRDFRSATASRPTCGTLATADPGAGRAGHRPA